MVGGKKKPLEDQSVLAENPHSNTRDGQLLPLETTELENNKTDDLYWESDEIVIPTRIIYDLEPETTNNSVIEESEDQTSTSPIKKVISRNVSNSQRRRFR